MNPTKHRTRLRLPAIAVTATGLLVGAQPATAATPVHLKQSFGPVAGDAPAGTLCDFAYHEEDTGTQNLTRFTDEAGNIVRVEDQVDVTILHGNSDTGTTLTEHLHYAAYVDIVDRAATVTGQSGRLVDEDGGSCWAARGSSRPTSSPATSLPRPRKPRPELPRRSAPHSAAPLPPEVSCPRRRAPSPAHSTSAEPSIHGRP